MQAGLCEPALLYAAKHQGQIQFSSTHPSHKIFLALQIHPLPPTLNVFNFHIAVAASTHIHNQVGPPQYKKGVVHL